MNRSYHGLTLAAPTGALWRWIGSAIAQRRGAEIRVERWQAQCPRCGERVIVRARLSSGLRQHHHAWSRYTSWRQADADSADRCQRLRVCVAIQLAPRSNCRRNLRVNFMRSLGFLGCIASFAVTSEQAVEVRR